MIQPWHVGRYEGQGWFELSQQFNATLEEIEYKLSELVSIKDALCGAVQIKLRELKEKEDELDDEISYYEALIKEEE